MVLIGQYRRRGATMGRRSDLGILPGLVVFFLAINSILLCKTYIGDRIVYSMNQYIESYREKDMTFYGGECRQDATFGISEKKRMETITCVLNGMTFFTEEQLEERAQLVQSLSHIEGSFVEAGVALGGTAILVTHIALGRPVHLYDVFGMIPAPNHVKDTQDAIERYNVIQSGESRGFGNDTYYGYMKDLLSQVKKNFETCNVSTQCVQFHKGLVEDTMKDINFDIAYLHCDTDFYSAVYHCLVDGAPHVRVGGYIVVDDFFSYGSAKHAVEDYFTEVNETHLQTSRNHVYTTIVTDVLTLIRTT